jgi:hypothetical protein
MAQNNVTLHRPDGSEARGLIDVSNDDPAGFDGLDFDIPQQQPQQPQQPQFIMPPQQQQQRPPPQRPPPPPPQPEELNDFANPNKIDDSPGVAGESPEMMDDFNEYGDPGEYYDDPQQQQVPPQIPPLPPFETLEDERADLMYKLQRAARNNIQVRTFGWNADIREMRAEVGRVKAEQEVDASIAFQRQILMTICTGMEFANKRFAYLDLELDGWSENMMDDIGKFDTVFEKLHKKHAGRMNIPPEMQLVFMIGGSALTWHLVAKSRKSRTIDEEDKKRHRSKKKRKKSRRYDSDSDSDESERSKMRKKYSKPAKTSGKDMRGPGFDVGGMMGGMGGLGGLTGMLPQVPVPDLNPQMFSRNAQQQQRPKLREVVDASPTPSNPPSDAPSDAPSNAPSERLSDIPSEELDDVPSTFGDDDFGMSLAEDPGTEKVFVIAEEKPKKGRRGRPPKNESKKIVII